MSTMRLAVYGTLAPGRVNHHQLAGLSGTWREGTVRGRVVAAEGGHKALILDPLGAAVEVFLFESPDLADHWARLDAFEGAGYQRVLTRVNTGNESVDAWIYVAARTDAPPP